MQERISDMIKTLALAAMAVLAVPAAHAWSASPTPVAFFGSPSSSAGHSVFTSRGPAFVTGHAGSMDTITLPGAGGQGFLMNNGNGSSTVFAPGAVPQTVITPR
jgi:hypothetical protein